MPGLDTTDPEGAGPTNSSIPARTRFRGQRSYTSRMGAWKTNV